MIDLCDAVVGVPAKRAHRFDFLQGDPGKNGRRARLPVDAFYEGERLVVEYHEIQHGKSVVHFDKPHRMTISNMHRGDQRKRYDERRQEVLPKSGITLVVLSYELFACRTNGRLRRDREHDLAVVRRKLVPILRRSAG